MKTLTVAAHLTKSAEVEASMTHHFDSLMANPWKGNIKGWMLKENSSLARSKGRGSGCAATLCQWSIATPSWDILQLHPGKTTQVKRHFFSWWSTWSHHLIWSTWMHSCEFDVMKKSACCCEASKALQRTFKLIWSCWPLCLDLLRNDFIFVAMRLIFKRRLLLA